MKAVGDTIREEYCEKITQCLMTCNDIGLLDLIYKILKRYAEE